MILAVKTYNTSDMIALSYAVDRTQGGYVKFTSKEKRSSKDVFMEQVLKKDNPQYYGHVEFVEVLDQDKEAASLCEKKLSHMILKSIKGFDNSFEQNMYRAIFSESVSRNDLSMISFVPEYVRRESQQRATTRELVNNFGGSKHIDNTKDAVGVASIFRSIYLSNYEKYMYVATTESGNLVRFYIKDKFAVGDKIRITSCKIKNKEQDKVTKLDVTVLNFVRYKKL